MSHLDLYKARLTASGVTQSEREINDGIRTFNNQLIAEGQSGTIDNTAYTFIVRQSSNPMNEFKEDRKILCSQSTPIHRGSIVTSEDITYLVVSDIDTNGVYQSGLIRKCNYVLKWQNEKGDTIAYPVIEGDLSLYTDGVQVSKEIVSVDTKVSINITDDKITSLITRDKRFIVDKYVYQTTKVDAITKPGILIVTMTEVEKNINDNFDLGIADYVDPMQLQPVTTDPIVTGYTLIPNEQMGFIIKKTETNQFIAHKYVNGIENFVSFEFNIDYHGLSQSDITVTLVGDSSVKIKNNNVGTTDPLTVIYIMYRELNTAQWYQQEVILKGLWG